MPEGISRLSNDDLVKIEEEASAALIHTQTEENTAKALVGEYNKILGDK